MNFKYWFNEMFSNTDVKSFEIQYSKIMKDIINKIPNQREKEYLTSQQKLLRGDISLHKNNELNSYVFSIFLKRSIDVVKDYVEQYPQIKNDYDKLVTIYNQHFPLSGNDGLAVAGDMVQDKIYDRTFKRNTINYTKGFIADLIDKIIISSGRPYDAYARDLIYELSAIRKGLFNHSGHKAFYKRLKKFINEDWEFFVNSMSSGQGEEVKELGEQLKFALENTRWQ